LFTPQTVLLVVFMFFTLVTVHEWGHFYFAKRAGILVREFAIGFGPKLFSFRRGETWYTLRLLPIGGFVRMAGEDPEVVFVRPGQTIAADLKDGCISRIYTDRLDERNAELRGEAEEVDLERELIIRLRIGDERRTYRVLPDAHVVVRGRQIQIAPWNRQFGSKTVGQRAMAIAAGPMMNVLLAFVLFMAAVALAGIPERYRVHAVVGGGPAERAGLQAGDVILRIDGREVGYDFETLSELIRNSNRPTVWEVLRDGSVRSLTVPPPGPDGRIGVELAPHGKRRATVGEVVEGGWNSLVGATGRILEGFRLLLSGRFTLDDLTGPVGIVRVSGEQAAKGLPEYTFWFALLSLYLAVFNLLPFPALDGSRLMFLALEAIRGKPVDPSRESLVHFIGFAMLMLLMLAVTYNDILNLVRR